MNHTLQLKGTFEQKTNNSIPGLPNIPSGATVYVSNMEQLQNDLSRLQTYWNNEHYFSGALISVYYNKVAAKSNRVQSLLSNKSIRGARFYDIESPKHLITHFITMEKLNQSIILLSQCINIVKQQFLGKITHEEIKSIISNDIEIKSETVSKSAFVKTIVDTFYVHKFDVFLNDSSVSNESIISIFKTDTETVKLMHNIGINIDNARVIDETTMFLLPDELETLKNRAPYLIAMEVSDLSELTKADFDFSSKEVPYTINNPDKEPTIGVIDTLFDENVYFSKWVNYKNYVSKDIQCSDDDFRHGTAVTSILVDGPSLNPDLDDECGHFKVRHFAVAAGKQFSSFSILRNIKQIVAENRDIKVWNLSLGSKLEVNQNFISPESAILDQIQYENDVVFVIAGTNKEEAEPPKTIGTPADSINSLVVNSVSFDNTPALYTRKGPVLSFFIKPDISYYGGDKTKKIKVCTTKGIEYVQGTSFAAPWIARKLCYLISVLGLSREVAKALIINSATTWGEQKFDPAVVGHGIVPVSIKDVVNTADDEIQFILYGVSEKYNTYNYNIPIPVNKEKQPFIVKATLCYFPCCSRNQGVDYTNTELDITIGRLNGERIQPIDNNYQSIENFGYVYEAEARKLFRKWDNVKHVREILKKGSRPKKVYDKGIWGISLKTKERLEKKWGNGLRFGLVVTLKELGGINRIEEFIHNCQLRGWLVNTIDVDNRIDIYNIAEETIRFED